MLDNHDMHVLSNRWAGYGPDHFIEKLRTGRGWVTNGACGVEIPTVFPTRKAAREAVDALVLERCRRWRAEGGQ
jgi:hypothetical protein